MPQILSRYPHHFTLVLCCMLGWGLFLEFLRSGLCVVRPQLLLVLVLSPQSQRLLDCSALVAVFVVFGNTLCLEITISFLKRSKYCDIIGKSIFFANLVFFLVRLQLNRVLLWLRLLHRLVVLGKSYLCLVLEYRFKRNSDLVNTSILAELDIDGRSVRFVSWRHFSKWLFGWVLLNTLSHLAVIYH